MKRGPAYVAECLSQIGLLIGDHDDAIFTALREQITEKVSWVYQRRFSQLQIMNAATSALEADTAVEFINAHLDAVWSNLLRQSQQISRLLEVELLNDDIRFEYSMRLNEVLDMEDAGRAALEAEYD